MGPFASATMQPFLAPESNKDGPYQAGVEPIANPQL